MTRHESATAFARSGEHRRILIFGSIESCIAHAICSSVVFASFVLSASRIAVADEPLQVQIAELRAGFAGHFKLGYWTPFEVVVKGGSQPVRGTVELIVRDCDAVPTRVRPTNDEPVEIAPGEVQSFFLMAKVGQFKSEISVGFRSGEMLLAVRPFGTTDEEQVSRIMPSGQELFIAVGSRPTAPDAAYFEQRKAVLAHVTDFRALPDAWWGYEGVDAIFLATDDVELNALLSTDGLKSSALDQWVRMGGRLILGPGKQAEKFLNSNSALARFVPGTLESMVPLRQSIALETYAESSEPLEGGLSLLVPKLRDVRGKIEAYAGGHPRDLPLVVRSPHGFGEVVFTAFDLDHPALTRWAARPQLLDKLLRKRAAISSDSNSGTLGQVTTLGFDDLSGQLRGALDQFASVYMAPFWLVALLALAYIACIGPLDFFLVKRVLKRMELTWATFAITVLLFSGGAYGLAFGLKGNQLRVKQVDVVDQDAESNLIRGSSWSNLLTPRIDEFDLSMHIADQPSSDEQLPAMIFSWLGLPGNGLGGMNPPPGSMPLFNAPYDFSNRLDALRRVPLAMWSSKAFVGRWCAQGACPIEAQLSDTGKLVGTLVSHASDTLEDCVLIYDRWAYPLRQFKPGRQIDIETQLDPQTMETYLRRVRIQGDRNVSAPYDRASFDIARIIEVMSAHELAGGESYTGLANQYQAFMDLSGLVKNGRAVLLGRRARPAAQLTRDGQVLEDDPNEHWTFCRYVFPVKQQSGP